jgi:peptidoglycan/LPS O-acetylase OafA/YrhL
MLTRIINALRRPSSSGSIILEIEGLRFIAIMSVLSLHMGTQILRINPGLQTTNDWLFWATENSGLGVNLFFSISGFILGYPYARYYLMGKAKMPVNQFYFKRLTRLEPPFIINITLFFILQVFLLHQTFAGLLPHYFATLTYSHMFVYGEWSNINPVTWSLETEVQFYLLAPLIFGGLYLVRKRSIRILLIVVLIVGTLITNFYFNDFYRKWHINKTLITYLDNFLIGILFLEIFLWPGFKEKMKASYLWDVCMILALFGFFEVSFRIPYQWGGVLADVCVALLFISAFKGKLTSLFFRNRVITTIGGMCYTIYLYHYAIFFFFSKYTAKIPVNNNSFWVQYIIQGIFLLAAVLIICSFLFYWFEKPFMVKNWYKPRTTIKINESATV